ncbi:MAG: FAD-binding oxidoreductase [Deltaproteobacteria bacterium]|nr:FAD-binding oxidoreductase [Deltaproteobacteria bacterium]
MSPTPKIERKPLIRALTGVLPAERVSAANVDRLAYARDQWARNLLAVRNNRPLVAPPDVVVWPESTSEVLEVVKIAADFRVPLVPWGAGSGVCGGAMALHGGIMLDLKRMNALVDFSATDQLATFQAGILGQHLEDQLNLRGTTLGHFPSSIHCSTLGGWLATRSAGQSSSRYGKIEDMVHSIEVVTGEGRVMTCSRDEEPELLQLIVGSEGTLGVITQATLRLHPLPATRTFRAYRFADTQAGCEAMRQLMQRGLRPATLRLYDALDTMMVGLSDESEENEKPQGLRGLAQRLGRRARVMRGGLRDWALRNTLSHAKWVSKAGERLLPHVGSGCLLIVGFEGDISTVKTEANEAHRLIQALTGVDLGAGPGLRWFEERHAVAFKQSPLYASGSFVDTLEVATTWSKLQQLHQAIREALSQDAVVLAHFSHAYPEGCSIYFTFAAAEAQHPRAEKLYDKLWRRGLEAAVRQGGTISHHHGIGVNKARFMHDEHGPGLDVYRQIKGLFDPKGILNPGKMGL